MSFIARQRDLRDALGEAMVGKAWRDMVETMDWFEGRFHVITLEDRNLPVIAQERLLKPISETARSEIDEAFEATAGDRKEVMEVLITGEGSKRAFRELYPFSPALVQVLVAVSSALQRERTALRILLQILCDQRERLALGEVVPVGDLWDAIAGGEEVFAPQMKKTMDDALRLWRDTLRPMILVEVGLEPDHDLEASVDDATAKQRIAFEMRARVAKTLLLAALVPGVESLKDLTSQKIAALNHGTIKTRIKRQEASQILGWVKVWASQIGQIKLTGDQRDPQIALKLSDVDIEVILRAAKSEDNDGNRKRLIRSLLFEALGIEEQDKLWQVETIDWRGTSREFELRYGNIREANAENLKAGSDRWVLAIDYPFDDPGYSAADDEAKIRDLRPKLNDGNTTIVWVPDHFSDSAAQELGNLVIINHLLSGTRLDGYTQNLNSQERNQAREQLDNRRSILKQRVVTALEVAFGINPGHQELVQGHFPGPADQFVSLDQRFKPQPPDATNLGDAMRSLLSQALDSQFPAHPEFQVPVKTGHLRKIADYVAKAVASGQMSTREVERRDYDIMRGIAEPLELGRHNENVFHLGEAWSDRFKRHINQHPGETVTVADLRACCDQPEPRGLQKNLANLVIWTFALQTDHRFTEHGGPADVTFEQLHDGLELRAQTLPDEQVWTQAIARAEHLFGYTGVTLRNGHTVRRLSTEIRNWVGTHLGQVQDLLAVLQQAAKELEVDQSGADRLKTAAEAADFMGELRRASDDELIDRFAGYELEADPRELARAVSSSAEVARGLSRFEWVRLRNLQGLSGSVGDRARVLLDRSREALRHDQRSLDLMAALKQIDGEINGLLIEVSQSGDDEEERRRREAAEERTRQLEAELERMAAKREQQAGEEAPQPYSSTDWLEVDPAATDSSQRIATQLKEIQGQNPGKRIRIHFECIDEDDDKA